MAEKRKIKNSHKSQSEMAAQKRMGVIVPGGSRRWKPFAEPGRSLLWSGKMCWNFGGGGAYAFLSREKDGLGARNCGEGRGKVRWCIYRVTPPQDSGFRIDELFTLQQHGAILRQLFGGNDYDWEIISESKDISLWNWGHVLTLFFGTCQRIGEGKEYQIERWQYAWKDRSWFGTVQIRWHLWAILVRGGLGLESIVLLG